MTQRTVIEAAFVLLVLATATPPGAAEDPPTSITPSSRALRDALFDELASDADRFQQQFGIVKRIVKLVTPTIVHIDAFRKESRGTGSGQRTIDEAGSGVVIQLDERDYVLTNRHVVHNVALEDIKIRLADRRFSSRRKSCGPTPTPMSP